MTLRSEHKLLGAKPSVHVFRHSRLNVTHPSKITKETQRKCFCYFFLRNLKAYLKQMWRWYFLGCFGLQVADINFSKWVHTMRMFIKIHRESARPERQEYMRRQEELTSGSPLLSSLGEMASFFLKEGFLCSSVLMMNKKWPSIFASSHILKYESSSCWLVS